MMMAERNLARLGQLVQYSVGKPDQYYFQQMSRRGGIEDDHIPFLIRGTLLVSQCSKMCILEDRLLVFFVK